MNERRLVSNRADPHLTAPPKAFGKVSSGGISSGYQNIRINTRCKDGHTERIIWNNSWGMEIYFRDPSYDRLEVDRTYTHGLPAAVVTFYRKRLQLLRAARDVADLTAMQCLRVRFLDTRPRRSFSVDLNGSHRLIVELRERSSPGELWTVEIREGQI